VADFADYISPMKNVAWSDLHLFLSVARGGGLSAAAKEHDSSPATIGRRMLALEQAIGRPLFLRRQTGYELTEDGRALLLRAQAMESGARAIGDWLEAEGGRSVVRISAGTWTTNFFAENFTRLWSPADTFRIAFKTTEAKLDIAHREVEIGVRNAAPQSPNLASRRTVEVAQAPFRARNAGAAGRENWVAISPEAVATRSARWLAAQPNITHSAWANTPRTLHDLIRAGVGKGVMPCFAGDRDPLLERADDTIAELREPQWLVMHNDDRHRADVRAVIERIVELVNAHAPLFKGERPLAG
jgi:DNA-binding transcriptional LysR family regulator